MVGTPYGCVQILPYDPAWPAAFELEKARLLGALGEQVVQIEHIGSTAVPGLHAKPTIDLMAGMCVLGGVGNYLDCLATLGYQYRPNHPTPGRLHFARILADAGGQARLRTHNLSLTAMGSPFWTLHLRFRDMMRSQPEIAAEYQALKLQLARQYPHDTVAYTEAKGAWIDRILDAAELHG